MLKTIAGMTARGSVLETSGFWPLALAAFGLFAIASAASWIITGTVVPWDSKNHFYPMMRYLGASLAAGEWPVWNPYHFSGHPTSADPQSLLFTPTLVIFAWLFPNASMTFFDLAIFAHLVGGGVAVIALFRRRGWHPFGAVLAAMIFTLGGAASSRLQHTGIIISYAFIPVALLWVEIALARASLAFGLLAGLAIALMALGRDQVAYLGCMLLLGAVCANFASDENKLRWLKRALGPLAVASLVAVAILTVPALLTLQFLGTSNRPAFGFGVAAMGSLPPVSLATFFWPNIFGSLNWDYSYWGPMPENVSGGTWMERASTYLFIGSLPALMVIGIGIARLRFFSREIAFFAIVTLIALIYSLGRYTPVFQWMFDYVPGVKLYRRPADGLFIVNFGLAMLAGWLVHRFIVAPREDATPHPVQRLAGLGAALVTAGIMVGLAVWAVDFSIDRRDRDVIQAAFGILPFVAAALFLAFGWRHKRVFAAATIVVLTGGELIWRNAASSMNAEPRERYAVFNGMPEDHIKGLSVLRAHLSEAHARGDRPRVEIIGMPNAWQNAAMVFGIEGTIGYNPLRIARFERAVGPGENAEDYNARTFPRSFRGYSCWLATMLGLEYLVLSVPIENLPAHFPRVRSAQLIFQGNKIFIYKLRQAAPRAYVAHYVTPVEFDEVVASGELPEFNRHHDVLLDEDALGQLSPHFGHEENGPEAARSRARVVKFSRNKVVIEAIADKPGLLVLHDLHYPGWIARVNGIEKPILRANLLFRAVEIPAGKNIVVFSFKPLSLANLSSAARSLLIRGRSNKVASVAFQAR